MANTHVTIKDELILDLKLKVEFSRASFYGEMKKDDLDEQVEIAKNNIKDRILSMVEDEYCQQDLSPDVLYDYKIVNAGQ